MHAQSKVPIEVTSLLPVLDGKLIELLTSLTPDEWQAQSIARLWKVKDIVAHLLDGNIRILSMLRDSYTGEKATITSYEELVVFLNGLNADWVKAMKRVSPQMLIMLHQVTGPLYCKYYASLDPFGKAAFSVAWAGEAESKNWMHIAKEYTEKWLHQQQIRDAVRKPGLMTREFFYPFIDIFMLGLPHAYRDVIADEGTTVVLTIPGDIGGSWNLTRRNNQWALSKKSVQHFSAEVIINADTAWKLFSKSLRPNEVRSKIIINGDQKLGEVALNMVSVMA